jgi:hypothetical protein
MRSTSPNTSTRRRARGAVALLAAVALGPAAVAAPAAADPGGKGASAQASNKGNDKGKSNAKSNAGDKGKSNAGDKGKSNAGGNGKSNAGDNGKSNAGDNDKGNAGGNGAGSGSSAGNAPAHSNAGGNAGGNGNGAGAAGSAQGGGQGKGKGGGKGKGKDGDPAGNNGTVKISHVGDKDTPDNNPHPGCSFLVEWYGFGPDATSDVTFAMQAPTSDATYTVVEGQLTDVQLDGDDASGAGTDTGLDHTEAYTLAFDGEPHPKQGYHVKLSVATEWSQGNDTKSKVFWVAPCEADRSGSEDGETSADGDSSESTDGSDKGSGVLGTQASSSTGSTDSGSSDGADGTDGADAAAVSGDSGAEASSNVPSAVDAGASGRSVTDWVRSPLPLLLLGLGALVAVGAVLARRRTHG